MRVLPVLLAARVASAHFVGVRQITTDNITGSDVQISIIQSSTTTEASSAGITTDIWTTLPPSSDIISSTDISSATTTGTSSSQEPTGSPVIVPSANVTSTSTSSSVSAPANTTTVTHPDPKNGDDTWDVGGDDIPLPPAMRADEMVLTLAYTANANQTQCRAMAADFASGASTAVRRHLAGVDYVRRRRRGLIPQLCLPAVYTIQATVHWVMPAGKERATWVDSKAWQEQLKLTRAQLKTINAALNINEYWIWTGPGAEKFTDKPKSDSKLEWAKAWVGMAKKRIGTEAYKHLNIFVVEDAGETAAAYANFPGTAALKSTPDALVMSAYTVLNNFGGLPEWTVNNDEWGTTLAHEIGHWLGLYHIHQGGCASKTGDYVSSTPQYGRSENPDYSKRCDGTPMGGKRGLNEHNLMSYASGRTRSDGFFTRDQAVRAYVGYMLRRENKFGNDVTDDTKKFVGNCQQKLRRDASPDAKAEAERIVVPRDLAPLSRRQTTDLLAKYCERTDLVVENHDFSEYAIKGLYNADSPPLPEQPAAPALPPVSSAEVQQQPEAGGETGSNVDDVYAHVKQQYDQTGSVTAENNKPEVPPDLQNTGTSGDAGGGGGGAASPSSKPKGSAGHVAPGVLLPLVALVFALW
ncbi:Extracellular metalloprotease 1 [Vanrija pseudolonga]|uniref:Extracellular metalloprotease 1 n=1 Tax=Vanrija pseudolonga TaxID=143232 RepID=A0AAF0Y262_9TREE|nr:Extracellular metalloprotease 1 [Vanrija pseudolonga]